MFFFWNFCQTNMPCRHQSLKYSNSNIHFISQKVIRFQSLSSQNINLSHASSVVHNFENHLRSHSCGTTLFSRSTLTRVYFHQKIFLSVASSEALIRSCSLMKYGTSIESFSFKMAVLSIFGKFPEYVSGRAHIQHSYELSVCALL